MKKYGILVIAIISALLIAACGKETEMKENTYEHISQEDSSMERVEEVKRTIVSVFCNSMENYEPFPKREIDLIIACEVLEHVIDLEEVLHKSYKMLIAGGSMIGSVPYLDKNDYQTHVRIFTKKNLNDALRNCGFRVNRMFIMPNVSNGKDNVIFFEASKGDSRLISECITKQ